MKSSAVVEKALSTSNGQARRPDGVRFTLVGESASWFSLDVDGEAVQIRPVQPLSQRCTIRPAALFDQDRGFPDLNTVMGRLIFSRGATEAQRYLPFTHDPHRKLCEVFLPVETMPDDDWPTSFARWSNCQTIARRLLEAAGVPWNGLLPRDVDELVRFVPWAEPLEGCVLHALTQWTHARGDCIVEIGSFRGRSASMEAMALRGVASEALLISIDPHSAEPGNQAHVRLALSQIGEENRLAQLACGSDQACRVLRPGAASLVFVDGDHSYQQVVSDFRNYKDILAPGGCMLFHDYGYGDHNARPEADPDVRAAIDQHVLPDREFRPLLLAHTLFAFIKVGGDVRGVDP